MGSQNNRTSQISDNVRVSSLALYVNDFINSVGDTLAQPSARIVQIESIIGTPEGRSAGTIGDLRVQADSAAVWQKVSGGPRTKTGWSRLSSASGNVTYGNAVSITTNTTGPGTATTAARSDHTHALTASAPSNGQFLQWNGSAWVPATISSPSAGGTPAGLTVGASGASGSSANFSRQDHVHAVPSGTAVAISSNANAAGSSTNFSRADHTHQLTSGTPSSGQVPSWNGSAWVPTTVSTGGTPGTTATTIVPNAAVAAGTSTNYARQDHVHGIAAATAVSIAANANAEGTSTSFSRADHTHQITTATPTSGQVPQWNGSAWVATTPASAPSAGGAPSGLVPDGASAAGTSTSYARQDHVHATPAATAVSISSNANAEGTSSNFSRADHTHQITTTTPTTGQVPAWNGSAWVATTVSSGGPSAGTTATTITPDDSVAAGTSTNYARQDHVHGIAAATAVSISGNANAEGTSTSFSRADHTHQLTTAAPSASGQVPQWNGTAWVASTLTIPTAATAVAAALAPDNPSTLGGSSDYARADHIHATPAATAVSISGNANAEGTSTSFSRADHTHQLTTAAPSASGQVPQWNGTAWVASTLTIPTAATAVAAALAPDNPSTLGGSSDYARADHVHATPAATAVTISGNANAEGTSTSFSRADHTHQLTTAAPTASGQVPTWNGSAWVAQTPSGGSTPSTGTAVTISTNTNAAGSGSNYSLANHTHQLTTAAPTTGQHPRWDGSNWVNDGLVEQGAIIASFDGNSPTGSDAATGQRVFLFDGATTQLGSVSVASWLTRTDSATAGTTLTITQEGIYDITFFAILVSTNANVKVNITKNAPSGLLDGTVIPSMQQAEVYGDDLVLDNNRVRGLPVTARIPITRADISGNNNVIRVLVMQVPVGTPTVQVASGQFVQPGTSAAVRIQRVGEVVG